LQASRQAARKPLPFGSHGKPCPVVRTVMASPLARHTGQHDQPPPADVELGASLGERTYGVFP
jgi:hypothetical protein